MDSDLSDTDSSHDEEEDTEVEDADESDDEAESLEHSEDQEVWPVTEAHGQLYSKSFDLVLTFQPH